MKLFEHKPFDAKAVLGFGILNGISIGLLSLGLGFNSVGFYQVILFYLLISHHFATHILGLYFLFFFSQVLTGY